MRQKRFRNTIAQDWADALVWNLIGGSLIAASQLEHPGLSLLGAGICLAGIGFLWRGYRRHHERQIRRTAIRRLKLPTEWQLTFVAEHPINGPDMMVSGPDGERFVIFIRPWKQVLVKRKLFTGDIRLAHVSGRDITPDIVLETVTLARRQHGCAVLWLPAAKIHSIVIRHNFILVHGSAAYLKRAMGIRYDHIVDSEPIIPFQP